MKNRILGRTSLEVGVIGLGVDHYEYQLKSPPS
jgi:hypothetical protein